MTFGELLQQHIDRGTRAGQYGLRWKLSDLASAVGVDEKTLYAWRKGLERPHDIRALLHVLFGEEKSAGKLNMIEAWQLLLPGAPERVTASPANIPAAGLCLGREKYTDDLVAALLSRTGASGLVLGGPGFGKSTLTKVVACDERVVRAFGGRRWFVGLETAGSAEDVIERIGVALHGRATTLDHLSHFLKETRSLLVLDNLETPWWGDRENVEALLRELVAISGLSLLASVRGDELVDGPEWSMQCWLKPLAQTPATKVFLRIAGRIDQEDPGLSYFIDEKTGVLGGIPLAIRLIAIVAGREGALAPVRADWERAGVALAERLGTAGGRLDSLIQSITVSVASPKLKSEGLTLLSLLGANPAGLTADDAEALIPGTWRKAVGQLRAVGLLEGRTRADLLPPVRDFAKRFCPLEDDLTKKWQTHFLELIAIEGKHVGAEGGAEALNRLLPELPNIAAAVEATGRAGSISYPGPVAAGLADTIRFGGLKDVGVLDRLSEFCALSQNRYGAATALFYGSLVLIDRADYKGAETRCGQALALFRSEKHRLGEANALKALADINHSIGNIPEATTRAIEALAIYRAEENLLGQANSVHLQARVAREQGAGEEAERLFRGAAQHYRDAGQPLGEANCLIALGEITLAANKFGVAKKLFAEALPKLIATGDLLGIAHCNFHLADTCTLLGEHEEAFNYVNLALGGYRALDGVDTEDGEARCLDVLGTLWWRRGELERSTNCFVASKTLYLASGNTLGVGTCERGMGQVAETRGEPTAALNHYRQALACYEQSQDALSCEATLHLISSLNLLNSNLSPKEDSP